jgi:hypothetical protein
MGAKAEMLLNTAIIPNGVIEADMLMIVEA